MDFKQGTVVGAGALMAASLFVTGALSWVTVALALVVLGVDAAKELLIDAKNRDERQALAATGAEMTKLNARVDAAEAEVKRLRTDSMAKAFGRG